MPVAAGVADDLQAEAIDDDGPADAPGVQRRLADAAARLPMHVGGREHRLPVQPAQDGGGPGVMHVEPLGNADAVLAEDAGHAAEGAADQPGEASERRILAGERGVGDLDQQMVEPAGPRPAAERAGDAFAIAEMAGQRAPGFAGGGDPEDGVDRLALVGRAAAAGMGREIGADGVPFGVGEGVPGAEGGGVEGGRVHSYDYHYEGQSCQVFFPNISFLSHSGLTSVDEAMEPSPGTQKPILCLARRLCQFIRQFITQRREIQIAVHKWREIATGAI